MRIGYNMRQRKPKDLDNRINECGRFLVRDAGPEAWEHCFDRAVGSDGENPGKTHPGSPGLPGFFLEIGCGKGDFILAKATADPANNYLGIEGQQSVLLRALEKAAEAAVVEAPQTRERPAAEAAPQTRERPAAEAAPQTRERPTTEAARPLGNLRFAGVYVRSMKDLFREASLDGIYLNFSDPWPKKRHYKRRLTWRGRLKEYAWALKPGGFIEIKTDNDDLFDFTLEEVEALGWTPEIMTRDLHSTDYEARLTMTEYEKKYHNAGKSINYLRLLPPE